MKNTSNHSEDNIEGLELELNNLGILQSMRELVRDHYIPEGNTDSLKDFYSAMMKIHSAGDVSKKESSRRYNWALTSPKKDGWNMGNDNETLSGSYNEGEMQLELKDDELRCLLCVNDHLNPPKAYYTLEYSEGKLSSSIINEDIAICEPYEENTLHDLFHYLMPAIGYENILDASTDVKTQNFVYKYLDKHLAEMIDSYTNRPENAGGDLLKAQKFRELREKLKGEYAFESYSSTGGQVVNSFAERLTQAIGSDTK